MRRLISWTRRWGGCWTKSVCSAGRAFIAARAVRGISNPAVKLISCLLLNRTGVHAERATY